MSKIKQNICLVEPGATSSKRANGQAEGNPSSNWENLTLESGDHKLIKQLENNGVLTISTSGNSITEISPKKYIGVASFSNFNIHVTSKTNMDPKNIPKLIGYAYELDKIKIIDGSKIQFKEGGSLADIIITTFAVNPKVSQI